MPFQRETLKEFLVSAHLSISASVFVLIAALSLPSPACADLSSLKKIIVTYNLEHHGKSLSDGSYGGEEGILRIRPEVASSFGLKALMDDDYIEAVRLRKKTDELLRQAIEAMETQKPEKFEGEHVKKVSETAVLYKRALQATQEKLAGYRPKLTQDVDERLNRNICSLLMERLLRESLAKTSHNLRDALGLFYNTCQDVNEDSAPLTPENVRFVNYVFREFTEKEPETTLSLFDLDRDNKNNGSDPGSEWKHVVGKGCSRYVSLLEPVLNNHKKTGHSIDPLLFFALMRQESRFNPRAVSDVGAAGLTQIMPSTAKNLGMKNIFMPPYFDEARSLMERQRGLRNKAMALIRKITKDGMIEHARQARQLTQKSLDFKRKWSGLYARYRQELLNESDDRLDPGKAIEHGFRYFVKMVNMQKGDISLALASYNAGPQRVKRYKGIPPYPETVSFRNGVLKYYREYLGRLKK